MSAEPTPWAPLAGRRVVEVGGGVATRYSGHLLARLGAEVVQVGVDRSGDECLGHGGESGARFGRWLDEGKRSRDGVEAPRTPEPVDLVIGGQDAAGVRAAEAFAASAGDGAAGPVLLALTWFGEVGPYASWRGTDEVIHALTGLSYSFGPAEGPPVLPQGHAPQVMAGAHAANVAMAAMLPAPGRRPRRLDVTILEAAMCLAEVGAVGALDDPSQVSTRMGVNRFSPTYPCSSYRTLDGWAGVTCLTPAQWQALCALVDRPDLAGEHRFSTSFRRLLRADEVDAALAPVFEAGTTRKWVEAGIANRIPIAPMPTPGQLPRDEHWRRRGAFAPVDGSDVDGPTLPFRCESRSGPSSPPPPAHAPGDAAAPLAGVRVVDFTMGWAGPQATRMLADLGADVVKIESATHPDWYRGWEADRGGDPPPTELRSNFNTLNRNKRGVVVELTTPEGLAAARALVAGADVVIENFAYGVLAKLGLSRREQHRLRPGLVSLTMPAFGSGGDLSPVRAYGSTVEQASGLPFVNGEDGWPPSLQHVAYGDAVAGIYAVTAILAGLAGRASGGADLDLAQVACLFELGADAIVAEQVHGAPLPRTGSRRARQAPTCVVAGRDTDTWLAVAVDGDGAWEALRGLVGPPGPPEDELVTIEGRHRHAAAVEAAVARWAAGRSAKGSAELLQARGVPAAPVTPVHDLGSDPHLVAAGFWETMERRYVGSHALGAPAFRLDGRRPAARCPAPTLGEHTAAVLAEVTTGGATEAG